MLRFLSIALGLAVGMTAAAAAGFPCEKFDKKADGTWTATAPVEIFGPNGRIDFTPGETYKQSQPVQGLDIAKLLEANCAKK